MTTTNPNPTDRAGTSPQRGWSMLTAGIVAATLVVWGAPAAAEAPGASVSDLEAFAASSDAIGSCRHTSIDAVPYVECDVATSGHVTFTDEALFAGFADDVAFTIAAGGGVGGSQSDWDHHYADPGLAGRARTVVDYASLAETGLYAYLGQNATTDYQGGTATVATTTPLDHASLGLDDVVLVAGGGGAQGSIESSFVCARHGYGRGGNGGRADAATAGGAVSARGADGERGHSYTGCRPSGTMGGGGGGGVGGHHGGNADRDGQDGIGGLGHDNNWRGDVLAGFTPGHGGGRGLAGGGGGHGGGAAGTGGHGAGGGGSYAAAPSATAPALVNGMPRMPSMYISWPQSSAPTPVADTHGDGDVTVTGPDGTVSCDDVTTCEASVVASDEFDHSGG